MILAFVTLALLSVPFAHRVGAAPVTAEMARFMSVGAQISDICGDEGGHIAGGCESCRIVDAVLVPDVARTLRPHAEPSLVRDGIFDQRLASGGTPHILPPVRAPPRV
jgi:hypothetical protein